MYSLAASYLGFITAEVLVGAGLGCIFGSDESLLRRSLKEGDGHFEFVARWNRVVLLQILATSFGFLLGEISMRIWSRLPFILCLLMYTAALFYAVKLKQPQQRGRRPSIAKLLRVLRNSRELQISIAAYAGMMALLRAVFWGYDELFTAAKSPFGVGIVLSVGAIVAGLAAHYSGIVRQKFSLFWLIIGVGLCFSLSTALMGAQLAPWCFALVFAHQLVRGTVLSTFSTEIHQFLDADEDADSVRSAIASIREFAYLVFYLMIMEAVVLSLGTHTIGDIFVGLGLLTLATTILLVVVHFLRPWLGEPQRRRKKGISIRKGRGFPPPFLIPIGLRFCGLSIL